MNEQLKYTVEDYYIPVAFGSIFAFLTILICISMLILIYREKARLHTIIHLIICDTCISSIFDCVVNLNNFIYLIFIRWETSDMNCRWRMYFIYTGVAAFMYSYMIQSVTRYFFFALSTKYRWLITFKTHYTLIIIKWFLIFLFTLPCLLTKDIYYLPDYFCIFPTSHILDTIYAYLVYYFILLIVMIVIYIYIIYRIKKIQVNTIILHNSLHNQKRDLEVVRNIVLIKSIFLLGGIPNILGDSIHSKIPHLINSATLIFSIFAANLCTMILDREVRHRIRGIFCQRTRIVPFDNAHRI